MANYAVVDIAGNIVNRIVLDAGMTWAPPSGFSTVQETGATFEIGGTYINGVYTAPPQPVIPPPTPAQVAEALRVAGIKSDAQRAAMLTRLQTATSAQIDTWVTNNVTTLAEARVAIGIILKLIALDSRQ